MKNKKCSALYENNKYLFYTRVDTFGDMCDRAIEKTLMNKDFLKNGRTKEKVIHKHFKSRFNNLTF